MTIAGRFLVPIVARDRRWKYDWKMTKSAIFCDAMRFAVIPNRAKIITLDALGNINTLSSSSDEKVRPTGDEMNAGSLFRRNTRRSMVLGLALHANLAGDVQSPAGRVRVKQDLDFPLIVPGTCRQNRRIVLHRGKILHGIMIATAKQAAKSAHKVPA